MAVKNEVTPSQVALAWLLAQKPFIVPIPGTPVENHLNENLGAIRVNLTSYYLTQMETVFSTIKIDGGHMNKMHMQQCE